MLTFIVNNGKGYPYENVTVRFEKDEIPDNILNILLISMNLCYSENRIGLDKNGEIFTFFDNVGFVAKSGKLIEPVINRWAINGYTVNFEVCKWLNTITKIYSSLFFHWCVKDSDGKMFRPNDKDWKVYGDIEIKTAFVERIGMRLQYNENGDFSCLEVMFEMKLREPNEKG